ncbi:MAG: nucleotidyltransferase family protein [Candidatus Omnitrophica bacterium]|nr:nucleotidyltransferase family protein [Candidatus Omnitrophota bacterium]MCB9748216.1 nucleotidyltransferase family protein [Candidatus Omnitrophota bacterium]
MISAILLSAGESSRFGSPKALVKLNSYTVIEQILTSLISSQVDEVITVLGSQAEQIKPFLLKHKKVKVVYNKDYNFGQTSSFQVGLNSLRDDSQGVFLLPVDYPFVKSSTIDTLIECFRIERNGVYIPTFENRKGHPPLFPIQLRNEFLLLQHDQGVNSVAQQHQDLIRLVAVKDSGVIATFNTPQEFDLISKKIGR